MLIGRRGFLALAGAAALSPRAAFASAAPPPDFETMVPVEGGRVYVRVNGRLDGPRPPLLMIHGGPGGNHASFLPALPLAADRAVVLYDQLDSGKSDRPDDPANWRVACFVDEVNAIRRALKLERLHVLGASWGGTVALEYVARRPKGLASAILESPLVSTRSWIADARRLVAELPPETRATIARCDGAPPPPADICRAADDVFYGRFLRRRPRPPEAAAYLEAQHLSTNAKIYRAMWGRSEFVSTGSLRHYDGEPLLRRLDGRHTLFATGRYDEARPETVRAFARRVRGAEFAVIPGSGHSIWNDNPEAMLALLRRWLPRHDRA